MDIRFKKNVAISLNKENTELTGKQLLKPLPSGVTRRPALGEVGNRHILPSKNLLKKTTLPTIPQKVVLKTSTTLNLKPVASKPTVAVAKKVAPTKNVKVLKRQDSTFNKFYKETEVSRKLPSYSSIQLGDGDDDDTSDDPLLVSEYINDIITYLLHMELKYVIKSKFLTGHSSTPKMRAVLINWMSEVATNFKYLTETFYLSVAIVDRYLEINKTIGRETLQLAGTAALVLAAKYEEMYVPDIEDFVYLCDDSFTKKQILGMEFDILKKLDFSFGRPLSIHFLRRDSKVGMVTGETHSLAKYILELGLFEYELCHEKPSKQAAAALCLATCILKDLKDLKEGWSNKLHSYTSYEYEDITSTMNDFAAALIRAETSKHQAIRKKFAAVPLYKVSTHSSLKGDLVKKLAQQSLCFKD